MVFFFKNGSSKQSLTSMEKFFPRFNESKVLSEPPTSDPVGTIKIRKRESSIWKEQKNLELDLKTGDAIYTSTNSSVKIQFSEKIRLELSQTSMLALESYQDQTTPHLIGGKFRIQVDGDLDLRIHESDYMLSGENALVELTVDENKKPHFFILRGPASLQEKLGAPDRGPASILGESESLYTNDHSTTLAASERPNASYLKTRISIGGHAWKMYSSNQIASLGTSPSSSGLSLEADLWGEKWGGKIKYKYGLTSSNTGGYEQGFSSLELRSQYNFVYNTSFHFIPEFSMIPFLGYEIYRSTGTNFNKSSNVYKLGLELKFPIVENWSTGGEFIYGRTADGSTKPEISGHLIYYVDRRWSMTFGYRVYQFEAGSGASSPDGKLPYRDAYTEVFSLLNYQY